MECVHDHLADQHRGIVGKLGNLERSESHSREWVARPRSDGGHVDLGEVAGIQLKVGSACRVFDGGGPAGADDYQDVRPLG